MSCKFIIGVDAALRNTGVTIIDNTGRRIDSFNITTPQGMADHNAVDKIYEEYFDRLARYYVPELSGGRGTQTFVEDITFSRRGDKTHGRAEAIGAIKHSLRRDRFNVYGVNPGAANSFLDRKFGIRPTKRASAKQKQHTKETLHRYWNFYTDNDNIADSAVVGLFGHAYLVEKQRLTCRALCKVFY